MVFQTTGRLDWGTAIAAAYPQLALILHMTQAATLLAKTVTWVGPSQTFVICNDDEGQTGAIIIISICLEKSTGGAGGGMGVGDGAGGI